MDTVGAITECSVATDVSGSIQTTIPSSTLKIDLSPLFHNIIHLQHYTSCIIAQSEPLTLLSPLLI